MNNYGKNLFKPWISVQNFVLLMATIFFVALLKLSSSELASWVQAVGSIVAIIGAFAISQSQLKKSHRDKVAEEISKSEIHHALADQAHQISMIFGNMLEENVSMFSLVENMSGRPRYLFSGLFEAMKAIQVHDLGSPMLVISHMQMMSSMENMLRNMDLLIKADGNNLHAIWKIQASISGDNFMLQGAWDMHVAAYNKRIESLNHEVHKALP